LTFTEIDKSAFSGYSSNHSSFVRTAQGAYNEWLLRAFSRQIKLYHHLKSKVRCCDWVNDLKKVHYIEWANLFQTSLVNDLCIVKMFDRKWSYLPSKWRTYLNVFQSDSSHGAFTDFFSQTLDLFDKILQRFYYIVKIQVPGLLNELQYWAKSHHLSFVRAQSILPRKIRKAINLWCQARSSSSIYKRQVTER